VEIVKRSVSRPSVSPLSVSRLSVSQGAAVSIGAVLGTGVIGLPALGAQVAGPASLVAWLVLIMLSIPLASTFAALGARYPDSGGVSTYARRAFGPRAAAVVGWCFYFAVPAGAPAAAMFGGAYVAAAFGGGMRTTLLTAAGLILVVTASNAGGLRVSGRVQLALAGVLALLLLVATLTALPHADLANLRPFAPNGWLAVGSAAAVLVWGFAGWEAVSHLAADFRRPSRDLPRATAVALVVVGALYLGVASVSLLVLGASTGSTEAPLAELLAIGAGGSEQAGSLDAARPRPALFEVKVVTAVVALLLTLGAMNAYFAGAAKLGAALGRDGALPGWLTHGSSAGEVPRRSLAIVAVLAGVALSIVALAGVGPTPSVLLATGSFVLVYVLGTAAAIRLLPKGSWARRGAFVAFGGSVVLLFTTGFYLLWTLAVAGAALVYLRRRSTRPAEPAPEEALSTV
jgi:amino acid efflux transporter